MNRHNIVKIGEKEYVFPILKKKSIFVDYHGKPVTQEDIFYFINSYEWLSASINALGEESAKHINTIEELNQEIDIKTDALTLAVNCLETRKDDMFLSSIRDACRFALKLAEHEEGDNE